MKQLTEVARAAKQIRAILKAEFAGIKFQVKSQNYTGGCSIKVLWVDGPSSEAVEAKIGHYEYGSFDGMIDLYTADNLRNDIPQCKYLFCEQEHSQTVKDSIKAKLEAGWGVDFSDQQAVKAKFGYWPDQVIWQAIKDPKRFLLEL